MIFNFDTTINMALIFTLASAAVAWLVNRFRGLTTRVDQVDRETEERISEVERTAKEERTAIEKRVSSVEQALAGLPSSRDLHALQLTMAEVRGDMREMRAVMEGSNKIMGRLETIVVRHEEHLLEVRK